MVKALQALSQLVIRYWWTYFEYYQMMESKLEVVIANTMAQTNI